MSGKRKFVPVLNLSLCHEDVRWSGGIALPFLTTALDGGEWSGSRPGRFISGERAFGTHCAGAWLGARISTNAVVQRNIPCPYRK
jgi:hypothetical protein